MHTRNDAMPSQSVVYIVDDDHEILESMRLLLSSVGIEARMLDSAEAFFDAYDPHRPGCLIVDLVLPGMSGLELHECLSDHGISIPVIVLTGYPRVDTAVASLRRGAIDYLQKPVVEQDLLDCIQSALQKDRGRWEKESERRLAERRVADLTPRELQIFRLIVAGERNKNVAQQLNIKPKTVDAHRARVMQKLRANNVADLVRIAYILGLIDDPPP